MRPHSPWRAPRLDARARALHARPLSSFARACKRVLTLTPASRRAKKRRRSASACRTPSRSSSTTTCTAAARSRRPRWVAFVAWACFSRACRRSCAPRGGARPQALRFACAPRRRSLRRGRSPTRTRWPDREGERLPSTTTRALDAASIMESALKPMPLSFFFPRSFRLRAADADAPWLTARAPSQPTLSLLPSPRRRRPSPRCRSAR